jgi:H+/Cl- antiporter ClcA
VPPLLFQAAPEALNNNIIHPSALAVHADVDAVIFQYIGEIFTGKLAALVAVEYLRCAIVCQRFFQRLNTKSSIQSVG